MYLHYLQLLIALKNIWMIQKQYFGIVATPGRKVALEFCN